MAQFVNYLSDNVYKEAKEILSSKLTISNDFEYVSVTVVLIT